MPKDATAIIVDDGSAMVSRAKVIKKVDIDKFVAVIAENPEASFRRFAGEFVAVEAAGGAVLNDRGELLMISLRGRWDLPKGHIEEGEESSVAALREVEEETGIVAEIVGTEPLATTYHAYDTYGRWELKRTEWWQMRQRGGELCCQSDEGIAAAGWCTPKECGERLKMSYPTIKMVVEALGFENENNLENE